MKKTIEHNGTKKSGRQPFWMPWGGGGYIGRWLLFLLLLFVFILLLTLFRGCDGRGNDGSDDDETEDSISLRHQETIEFPEDISNPDDSNPTPHIPIDTTSQIRTNIPNPGPNLPSPDDNFLPPIDSDDIITDDENRQIVADQLNVILDDPTVNDETYRRWANEFKSLYPGERYQVIFYDPLTRMLKIRVPADQRDNVMRNLPGQINDISFKIFPDGMQGFSAVKPNDPVFKHSNYSWYFAPIQAYEAWEITQGSPDVVVAVVDSYFDLSHDELNSDRIVKPFSIPRRTGNVAPVQGCDEVTFMHGSMVASQAIGNINNKRGAAGIAPKCKFMPISMGHQFTSMTILQGVLYAIYQGAHVINVSAGAMVHPLVAQLPIGQQIEISKHTAKQEEDVWEYVTRLANERNVTIVWAAGNQNVYSGLDPSKRSNATIRVSALDHNLKKADFSNYGNYPQQDVEASTISAPGVDIFGAMPYNSYNMGPGTSFSAPIVTGAVALMKSLSPSLSTQEIIRILKETGKPIAGDNTIGKLIQIKDALLKVKSEMANFDDIMHDHNKLLGLWQSTTLLDKYRGLEKTSEVIRVYFDVQSTTQAKCIYYEVSGKKDYTAPVSIEWNNDHILFRMQQNPKCPQTGEIYTLANFKCTPDNERLMVCNQTNLDPNVRQIVNPYHLRKVSQRTQE